MFSRKIYFSHRKLIIICTNDTVPGIDIIFLARRQKQNHTWSLKLFVHSLFRQKVLGFRKMKCFSRPPRCRLGSYWDKPVVNSSVSCLMTERSCFSVWKCCFERASHCASWWLWRVGDGGSERLSESVRPCASCATTRQGSRFEDGALVPLHRSDVQWSSSCQLIREARTHSHAYTHTLTLSLSRRRPYTIGFLRSISKKISVSSRRAFFPSERGKTN